jgi:hypothetical protein
MLIRAFKRDKDLKELLEKEFDNKEYSKYYFTTDYFRQISIDESEYYGFNYISVDKSQKILGFIGCEYNRESSTVSSCNLINLSEKPNIIFVKDVFSFVKKLFVEIKVDHITWYCMKGNPAEKIYDKFIDKYHGNKSSVIPRFYYKKSMGYVDAYIYTLTKENYFNY